MYRRPLPVGNVVAYRQEGQLFGCGLRWEQRTSLDDLTNGAVQALNQVRRVDEHAYILREVQERHQLRPGVAPGLSNSRAALPQQQNLKGLQRLLRWLSTQAARIQRVEDRHSEAHVLRADLHAILLVQIVADIARAHAANVHVRLSRRSGGNAWTARSARNCPNGIEEC